ncbi:metal ABC transporter substrate-binding protein, partial [Pseudomonas sp. TNT3]
MSFSLRQLTLAVALCGLVNPTFAADKPLRVLASLPITYGLGDVLLKGTDVQLERAAPANLPGSRQTAYFTGRGAPALAKLATDADAVIGLRSLWPDDPLYPV